MRGLKTGIPALDAYQFPASRDPQTAQPADPNDVSPDEYNRQQAEKSFDQTVQGQVSHDVANTVIGAAAAPGEVLKQGAEAARATGRGDYGDAARAAALAALTAASIPRGGLVGLKGSGKPFYSALEDAALKAKIPAATGEQWAGYLRNQPNVKPEEFTWTGLDDFLQSKPKFTRDDVAQYLAENKTDVQEVWKSAGPDDLRNKASALSDQLQAMKQRYFMLDNATTQARLAANEARRKGATDSDAIPRYEAMEAERVGMVRDMERLDLEQRAMAMRSVAAMDNNTGYKEPGDTKFSHAVLPGGANYRELLLTLPVRDGQQGYQSSHWAEPNVLAHVRMNDRIGADGKKTLFLEELQSDWHQAGRDIGYAGTVPNKLPDATKVYAPGEYPNRNMGRNVWVVELPNQGGYGYGATRSEAEGNALYHFQGTGFAVPDAPFKGQRWSELALKRIFKYAADNNYDRVAWTPGSVQAARFPKAQGGLKSWYDDILPTIAGSIGKKYGMRVGQSDVQGVGKAWSVDLTPDAKNAAGQGMPLFSIGLPAMLGLKALAPDPRQQPEQRAAGGRLSGPSRGLWARQGLEQAVAAYPRLGRYAAGFGYRNVPADDSGRGLEFYPQGESDSFDPSRPSVETYGDKANPTDIAGDIVSHHLARGVDPTLTGYYDRFAQSLTPEQQDRLRGQYRFAQQRYGEERPFDQWRDVSGLPAYFRGYAFKQWDDNDGPYTPEQKQMFDGMMNYLSTPDDSTAPMRAAGGPVSAGAPDPRARPSRWYDFLPSESQQFLEETAGKVKGALSQMRDEHALGSFDPREGRPVITGGVLDSWASSPEAHGSFNDQAPAPDRYQAYSGVELPSVAQPPFSSRSDYRDVAWRARNYKGPQYHDVDPEGRPLNSLFIAGLGDKDTPLSSSSIKNLAALMSDGFRVNSDFDTAKSSIAGIYDPDSNTITVNPSGLTAASEFNGHYVPHELGHAIDKRLGERLSQNLAYHPDLSAIVSEFYSYNKYAADYANRMGKLYGSQSAASETIAEALKDYLVDPAGLKRHAPLMAKFLRDQINTDPQMSKYLTLARNDQPADGQTAALANGGPVAPDPRVRPGRWYDFLPDESVDFLDQAPGAVKGAIEAWRNNRVDEHARMADPTLGRSVISGAETDETWRPPGASPLRRDRMPNFNPPNGAFLASPFDLSGATNWDRQAQRALNYKGPAYHDTDPEGRPLDSLFVAGLGERDHPLSVDQVKNLSALLTEGSARVSNMGSVPDGKVIGEYLPATNSILYNKNADPDFLANRAIPHETGHAISALLGGKSSFALTRRLMARPDWNVLEAEIRGLPDQGFAGTHATAMIKANRDAGVPDADVVGSDELIAEALSRYMTNPGWFKYHAPQAARALRDIVNTDPHLSKYFTLSQRETEAPVQVADASDGTTQYRARGGPVAPDPRAMILSPEERRLRSIKTGIAALDAYPFPGATQEAGPANPDNVSPEEYARQQAEKSFDETVQGKVSHDVAGVVMAPAQGAYQFPAHAARAYDAAREGDAGEAAANATGAALDAAMVAGAAKGALPATRPATVGSGRMLPPPPPQARVVVLSPSEYRRVTDRGLPPPDVKTSRDTLDQWKNAQPVDQSGALHPDPVARTPIDKPSSTEADYWRRAVPREEADVQLGTKIYDAYPAQRKIMDDVAGKLGRVPIRQSLTGELYRPLVAVDDLMKAEGFEPAGTGSRAKVYVNKESGIAAKYFRNDPPYLQFLDTIHGADSPHFPKIYDVKKFGIGDHMVMMEPLAPLAETDKRALSDAVLYFRAKTGKGYNVSPEALDTFGQRLAPDFKRSLDKLASGIEDSPSWSDLHFGNIMKRKDGTFVITDPYYDPFDVLPPQLKTLVQKTPPPKAEQTLTPSQLTQLAAFLAVVQPHIAGEDPKK